jgi:hypothetical protein
MDRDTFRPPKYEETLHLLFEKETGKVVASERRWTLIAKKRPAKKPLRSDLLERVIAGLDRPAEEFDVLVVTGSEASKPPASRVDVSKRRPVREKERRGGAKGTGPFRLERP